MLSSILSNVFMSSFVVGFSFFKNFNNKSCFISPIVLVRWQALFGVILFYSLSIFWSPACDSPHVNSFLPFQVHNPIKVMFGWVLTSPYFLYDWLSILLLSLLTALLTYGETDELTDRQSKYKILKGQRGKAYFSISGT